MLKGFRSSRGEPTTEIELHFKAYGPFTRDFWGIRRWPAGGYMAFPSTSRVRDRGEDRACAA